MIPGLVSVSFGSTRSSRSRTFVSRNHMIRKCTKPLWCIVPMSSDTSCLSSPSDKSRVHGSVNPGVRSPSFTDVVSDESLCFMCTHDPSRFQNVVYGLKRRCPSFTCVWLDSSSFPPISHRPPQFDSYSCVYDVTYVWVRPRVCKSVTRGPYRRPRVCSFLVRVFDEKSFYLTYSVSSLRV